MTEEIVDEDIFRFEGINDSQSIDEVYDSAINALENDDLENAKKLLDFFLINFPDAERIPLVLFWLGEISFINGDIDGNYLVVSGDLLSGTKVSLKDGMGHLDNSISLVIDGSSNREFLGWIMPGFNKPSLSRTFLSFLLPDRKVKYTNNLNGSLRAIIPFGRWDKFLPLEIYSDFLVKSILAKDIDMMENLGIYECAEEDFALCSYVCQSKTEVSQIIKKGVELAALDE